MPFKPDPCAIATMGYSNIFIYIPTSKEGDLRQLEQKVFLQYQLYYFTTIIPSRNNFIRKNDSLLPIIFKLEQSRYLSNNLSIHINRTKKLAAISFKKPLVSIADRVS
ncbi:hypothetical protein NSQ43_13015 [Sporosarcina sp. FSL W8-0480]|uniref:hypothetical protein n=1 Tax=Sporosarcina sp. FSL W8-0480 TaxID=2954701 RepID=UPI0030DC623A